MNTIAIQNQKGGTAKSTTTINLAAGLAELGRKVLVIDLDQQGSTSNSLGLARDDNELGSFAIIGQGEDIVDHVYETTIPLVDAVPAHLSLAMTETAVAADRRLSMNPNGTLKDALSKLPDSLWDYILIDCPPALGILTKNAMVAAKNILIPVETQYMPMEGVAALLETIQIAKQGMNPDLTVLGILASRHQPKALNKEALELLRSKFGASVFQTVIKENTHIAEAPSHKKSVLAYAPKSPGASNFRELAQEVIARLELQEQQVVNGR